MTKTKKRGRKLLKWVLIILFVTIASGAAYFALYPDVTKLKRTSPKKTAFMEYRQKEWKSRESGSRFGRIGCLWAEYLIT
jgi:flagellar basal body-associated protein FliL